MEDASRSRDAELGEADKDRLIEELREAVRARDEFVAIAAHELRNPMTPILMQVNLLRTAAKDPRRGGACGWRGADGPEPPKGRSAGGCYRHVGSARSGAGDRKDAVERPQV